MGDYFQNSYPSTSKFLSFRPVILIGLHGPVNCPVIWEEVNGDNYWRTGIRVEKWLNCRIGLRGRPRTFSEESFKN